jgi:hypothetical protein
MTPPLLACTDARYGRDYEPGREFTKSCRGSHRVLISGGDYETINALKGVVKG